MSEPVFVGLDYHQEFVQVCVLDRTGHVLANRRCPNDRAALARAAGRHGSDVRAAIEACCGAADLAEELVSEEGWSVDLAHPGYVARIKRSPDKSDCSDARLLADLERVGYLPRVWLAPERVRQLRRLVRYRQRLVAERKNVKLRIGAPLREERLPRPIAGAWTRGWLAWLRGTEELGEQSRWVVDRQLARLDQLSAEILEVERRLGQAVAGDPLVERLLRLKGVGLVTAVTIRAEIGRFDRFRAGKQPARFCGLSPRNASSGGRQADAGLIKAGSPGLRSVLIEAAHRLMRYDDRWKALTTSLVGRGKRKMGQPSPARNQPTWAGEAGRRPPSSDRRMGKAGALQEATC
jgi:transposase